jgi:hypothetical protein
LSYNIRKSYIKARGIIFTNIYLELIDVSSPEKEDVVGEIIVSAKKAPSINPLIQSRPWHYHFYKRVKLFPWWFLYNVGAVKEAVLKNRIIKQATDIGLQDRWTAKLVRHAVSEFSKRGLGTDYYGYHNIDHELQAAYFTLLAANGHMTMIR